MKNIECEPHSTDLISLKLAAASAEKFLRETSPVNSRLYQRIDYMQFGPVVLTDAAEEGKVELDDGDR